MNVCMKCGISSNEALCVNCREQYKGECERPTMAVPVALMESLKIRLEHDTTHGGSDWLDICALLDARKPKDWPANDPHLWFLAGEWARCTSFDNIEKLSRYLAKHDKLSRAEAALAVWESLCEPNTAFGCTPPGAFTNEYTKRSEARDTVGRLKRELEKMR